MKSMRTGAVLGALLALAGVSACREEMMMTPEDTGVRDTGRRDTNVEPDATVEDTGPGEDSGPGEDGSTGEGGVVATNATLRDLQDITAAGHPMNNQRINLMDTGLVALTPRTVIGSASGTDTCRFGFWVGKVSGGDFTGIQVQESVRNPTMMSCFSLTTGLKIPADLQAGAAIAGILDSTFSDFCLGPTGVDRSMCRNFEQSQIFLGGAGSRVMLSGTPMSPMPLSVTTGDLVIAAGAPGPRALALEGTLVRVSNVRAQVTMGMSGMTTFTTYALVASDDSGATRPLQLVISNFIRTSCVRNFLSNRGMTPITSVTGILTPDFGVWKLRLRDENDIEGIGSCATDGGM